MHEHTPVALLGAAGRRRCQVASAIATTAVAGWLERGTRDAPFRLTRTGDPGGAPLPAATDRR